MLKKIINSGLIFIFALSTFGLANFAKAGHTYSGEIIKASGLSTLYYVSDEGKRYVFPNENIFKSWFPDFDDVITTNYNELISIPLSGNVFYRPGVILVKITTDPKIYTVGENGELHWIETEELARELYGDQWNMLVDDLPDAFFANYRIGSSISNASDYDPEEEINRINNIGANHGLKLGHIKKARTGKCKMVQTGSSYLRVCKASDNANDYNDDSNDDEDSDTTNPYIESIKVYDEGDEGYIDEDDVIKITFS